MPPASAPPAGHPGLDHVPELIVRTGGTVPPGDQQLVEADTEESPNHGSISRQVRKLLPQRPAQRVVVSTG